MTAAGFAAPVADAQRTFRALLDAMAQPGRVVELSGPLPTPTPPLTPVAYAVALTLLDFETPLWLDAAMRSSRAAADLRLHCGAPFVDAPKAARYALVSAVDALPSLSAFHPGEDEYPDRSTTVIVQVERLRVDGPWNLQGPGIKDMRAFGIEPEAPTLVDELRRNAARYPLGVDMIWCADQALAALPRSTRLEG